MTEAELMAAVRELAGVLGWLVYHTYRSTRSPAGFPDLMCARGSRLVAAELKTDRGRVTETQREWLDALEAAGVEVFTWMPEHWRSGEIEQELRRTGDTCSRSPRVHAPPRRQEGAKP